MIEEKDRIRDSVLDSIVAKGDSLSVVLETYEDGYYSAHSDSFVEVRVEAPYGMHGEIVDVIPVSHKDGIIIGKLK